MTTPTTPSQTTATPPPDDDHAARRTAHEPTTRPDPTGPWRPNWSPGSDNPDLAPLTVVHDTHDDHAFGSCQPV